MKNIKSYIGTAVPHQKVSLRFKVRDVIGSYLAKLDGYRILFNYGCSMKKIDQRGYSDIFTTVDKS